MPLMEGRAWIALGPVPSIGNAVELRECALREHHESVPRMPNTAPRSS